MPTPQDPPPSAAAARAGGLVCPVCRRAALERRHRSTRDRVLSLFVPAAMPLRRYACAAVGCGWQGLLRGHLTRPPGYLPEQWL